MATWTITDGTKYVSPIGDDIIGLGTQASPYATLGKAVAETANSTASKIVMGSGLYIESNVLGLRSIEGDGEVIFDQGGVLTTYAISAISGSADAFRSLTFRNFTTVAPAVTLRRSIVENKIGRAHV